MNQKQTDARIQVASEQIAAKYRDTGKKVEISELELYGVLQLARLGLGYVFSKSLRGAEQRDCLEKLQRAYAAYRASWGDDGTHALHSAAMFETIMSRLSAFEDAGGGEGVKG